ncbi:MAG: hypothetical protein ACR2K4_03330 [Candidatus Limnocylindria bacterium]
MEFIGFPLILVPAVVLGRVLVRAGLSSTGVTAGIWILTAAVVAALGAAAGSVGVPAFILLWPIALALVGLAAWLIVRPDPTTAWISLAAATLVMALGVIGVLTSTREFHAAQWMIAGFGAAALYFSDSYLREHGR